MGKTKYSLKVVSIGELAKEFLDEGIMVFFGTNAPEELQEHSIVHEHSELTEDVVPGDTIVIGSESFNVLAVGKVANENLRNLGHLVLKFNGLTEPEMDGDVTVAAVPLPEIQTGTGIEIRSGT
jgi:glucitol/sorbitol PTS system EIIA component